MTQRTAVMSSDRFNIYIDGNVGLCLWPGPPPPFNIPPCDPSHLIRVRMAREDGEVICTSYEVHQFSQARQTIEGEVVDAIVREVIEKRAGSSEEIVSPMDARAGRRTHQLSGGQAT